MLTRLFALFASWRDLGASLREALLLTLRGVAPLSGGVDSEVVSGAAETVQRWAARIWIESAREIYWAKFIKERDANAIIESKTELEKQPGDKITFTLSRKLSGAGVTNDDNLEGQEEALTIYSDSVTVAQQRNAVRLKGNMSERRTAFDQRKLAKTQLATWLAEYIDDNIFTQMDSSPTTSVWPGAATSTATLLATDLFTPVLIDRAVAKAKKALPKLYPVKIDGRDLYVMLVHTDVAFDIKTGGNSGTWQTVQQYAGVRDLLNNRIFSGALGYWGGAILHEHEKVPTSTTWGAGNNVNGASNFFLARQAGIMAWGAKPQAWQKEFNYGTSFGFAIGAVWGFKKAVFSAVDHGLISLRTARTAV